MLSWQIGAVKITCVVEMVIPFPEGSLLRDATAEALKTSPWLFPHFAKEDGTLIASVQALLVEAPGLRLVVDTCIGNDKPRNLTGGNPLATSEGQSAVITGDIAHHPCQMAHPVWATSYDSDTQGATATRAKLFAEWADQPILVIGTHYAAPTAGHVKRDGAAFRFEV
jgi:hypothetical protein